MKKFLEKWRAALCAIAVMAVIPVGIIAYPMLKLSGENKIVVETLYSDGIMPAMNSDDGFTGEIIKVVTPTKSKVVMLGIRQSSVRPGSEVINNVANAIFFAIGDETMRVGEKVHVRKYWHAPHNQLSQNYTVWLAAKLDTNQVAEKK
ncbi:MAG: hypothetical protein AAB391_00940 [Patescibacteria group bacterium]